MNFIDKLIRYVKQFLAIEPVPVKEEKKVTPKKSIGLNPKKKKAAPKPKKKAAPKKKTKKVK